MYLYAHLVYTLSDPLRTARPLSIFKPENAPLWTDREQNETEVVLRGKPDAFVSGEPCSGKPQTSYAPKTRPIGFVKTDNVN